MNKILQSKFYHALLLAVLFMIVPVKSAGQIIGWDASANGGGFGASPWTPVALDSHLETSGLIRGSSIGTGGGPAVGCWGGANGWTGTPSDAGSFYFTFQAVAGYKISLSAISSATRRSNAGPVGCSVWYSVDNAPPVKIADWNTTSTSGTNGTPNNASLADIPDLQDIQPGIVVKFYIVPQGTAGNYYVTGGTNCLRIEGAVAAAIDPLITPSVNSLDSFGEVMIGNTSAAQSFTFDGVGLTDEVSIAAPAGFEISTDNVNWYVGSDISPENGSLEGIQVWVRFNPAIAGPVTGDIVLSSPGAADKTVTVSGTGQPALALSIWPDVVDSLAYPENGGPSAPFQMDNLTTVGLSPSAGTILIAVAMGAESDYEVSTDGITWGPTAELAYASADNNITDPSIYVRLKAGISQGTVPSDVVNVTGGGLSTFFLAAGIVDPPSTIVTEEETYGPFCNGTDNTFDLDFTPTGSFTGQNFYAQLSDPDGNFPSAPINIVGMSQTSPITVSIPSGTPAGTHYRVRTYNDNPLTFSSNDNGHDIVVNSAISLSGVAQQQTVCSGEEATIAMSGLLPDSTFTVSYAVNDGTVQTIPGLTADAAGIASFDVLLTEQNNGQPLTITGIERTDVSPSCANVPALNNIAILSVNPTPAITAVAATAVCGSGEMSTVSLTGLLGESTSDINYTIAGGTVNTATGITADASGLASFMLPLEIENNGQLLEIVSITRTDVQPSCIISVTGIATALIINERPTAAIGGDQSICFGSVSSDISIALTGTPPWNITYTDGIATFSADDITESPYLFNVSIFGTRTYTVTAVEDAHCQAVSNGISGSATVTVSPFSIGGNLSGSTTVCSGLNSGTLELSGNAGNVVKWQSSDTIDFSTVTDLDNTTNVLEYSDLAATTYYRAVISNGSCPAVNSAIAVVSVNVTPPLATQPQEFCKSGHVADLFPSGSSINWYSAATGGSPLLLTDVLASGDYYVTQTLNGCESARTATPVTINTVPVPEGEASQEFEQGDSLADLDVSGTGLQWYQSAGDIELGTALDENLLLTDATTYYVTQNIAGCASDALAVTVSMVLGIPDFDDKNFRYYPNPVQDVLHINYTGNIGVVAVFNITGQQLLYANGSGNDIDLDVSGLAEGTYLVKVIAGNATKTFKFVKK